jgi:RND superfamily putative drug exporter
MLVNLADWCFRRRRVVVITWLGALVVSFLLAGALGGEFRQDYLQPGSESRAASQALEKSFPQRSGDTVQIVLHAEQGVTSSEVRDRAEELFAEVARSDDVVGIASPFAEGGAAQVSADGTTAYADVALSMTVNEYTPGRAAALVDPILEAGDNTLQVEVGGPVAALSQAAPVGSEVVGLVAAAIILLFTFGSVVAMGLPLITALFGLGVAMALGEVLRRVVDVPDWAPATAAMVGIGVGIDYALLIVTRYRTSLAAGQDPRHATTTAI